MLDIADIYKEIQETDKLAGTNRANALVETLAGKNRSNIAASILQNPDLLRNAYETSVNSAGTGMKELDVYTDSVNAKMQQLQNHLQELTAITIDSKWLKDLIDLGTKAVEVVTFLVDKFGGLSTILGTIGGILTQKMGLGLLTGKDGKIGSGMIAGIVNSFKSLGPNREIKKAISSWVKDNGGGSMNFGELLTVNSLNSSVISFKNRLADESLGMSAGLQEYINKLGEAKAATMSLQQIQAGYFQSLSFGQKAISGLTNVMSGLLSTVLTVGAEMLIFTAIGAGFNAIMDAVHAHENKIKAGQEARMEASKIKDNMRTAEKTMETATKEDRYNKLRSGVKMDRNVIENISLTNSEYEEFLELNQQMADKFPQMITGYTESG